MPYPQIPGRTALDPPNNYCVVEGGGHIHQIAEFAPVHVNFH